MSVPSTISFSGGELMDKQEIIRPRWSWSFRNQALAFLALINKDEFSSIELERAIRPILLAENIFKKYIK